jgi:SET domain-containing protein
VYKRQPVCFIHLKYLYGLKIGRSTIPRAGFGLFALKNFDKHERLCEYTGDIITIEELNERYGEGDLNTAPYALTTNFGIIDSACSRGIASWINQGTNRTNNVTLEVQDDRVDVVATKKIRPGTEIFTSYGDEYEIGEDTFYKTIPYSYQT